CAGWRGTRSAIQRNTGVLPSFGIYGEGVRVTISSQVPMYSLHMDADVGTAFGPTRQSFDGVLTSALATIKTAFASKSVQLKNPDDLDFSYTNGTNAYSVLKSLSAYAIRDPLGVAIRDWHRLRGK